MLTTLKKREYLFLKNSSLVTFFSFCKSTLILLHYMTIPNKFYFNHQFKQDNNIPYYNASSSEKILASLYGHVRTQDNSVTCLWVALEMRLNVQCFRAFHVSAGAKAFNEKEMYLANINHN